MCFSTEAELYRRRLSGHDGRVIQYQGDIPVALIPLIFASQQIIEGLL
ncbi:hypothetical protein SAMN05216302_100679 [Nitrosomonas aestuarii]|uniref:Uncharacterized protein n=1 Tax=Nitrosomonas aestuarii TaxID=52441 RepID=A0A1I3ZG88_9PROT|nr:hypothetical protein [Nitrosomonas aestuarii]SFK43138.1 hypothetical protein SAMN05216302_100679 [Nitrosomonas aestuarii]